MGKGVHQAVPVMCMHPRLVQGFVLAMSAFYDFTPAAA